MMKSNQKDITLFFIMILLISLLSTSSQNVDALEGYEWTREFQDDNPYYCVMKNPVYKNYYRYIREGTNDWERMLHAKVSTIAQRALWDISVIFVDKKFDVCDVMVYLDARVNAPVRSDGTKSVGAFFGNDKIILYIKDGQDPKSVRLVISHEVGHTLGLGHYVSDREKSNFDWRTTVHAPSIMIPTQHWNDKMKEITDRDINKIREIYGDGGFSKPPLVIPAPITPPPITLPPTYFDSKIFLNQPTGKMFVGEQISISGYLGKVEENLNKRLPSDFEPVSNGKIYFSILGEDWGFVTTNSYGRFSFPLTIPTLMCDDCKKQDIPLSFHFEGDTNLDSSSATLAIPVHDKYHPKIIVQKNPENPTTLTELTKLTVQVGVVDQPLERVISLKYDFVKTIKDLESGVEISEKSLSGLTFQKKEAQEKINLAWDYLKENKKMVDALSTFYLTRIDTNIANGDYNMIQPRIDSAKNSVEKVVDNLAKISLLSEDAKRLEVQKFCFLFWCW